MGGRVMITMQGRVAVITLMPSGSETTGFDPQMRGAFSQALDQALADPMTRSVLIVAGPGGWNAPPDPLAEWQASAQELSVELLAARVAQSKWPVIAAVSGQVSGAVLALAVAADWRLAAQDTRLALPELGLAALPGGGVLVRLARLLGAQASLAFALSLRELQAQEAAKIGLLDELSAPEALAAAALTLATGLSLPDVPQDVVRRDRAAGLSSPSAFLAAVADARRMVRADDDLRFARHRLIDCIEAAALLPEEEAHDFVEVARAEVAETIESRAYAHLGAAERRAAQGLAGLPRPAAERVRVIGLWDVGRAGARLAEAFLAAGFEVRLATRETQELAARLTELAQRQAAAEASGQITAQMREAAWARIAGGVDASVMAGVDLVLAGAGRVDDLAAELPPKVVLALLAAPARDALARSPLLRLSGQRMAELSLGPQTPDADLARLAHAMTAAGFVAVHAGNAADGGIVARLKARLAAAAERLVLAGATPLAVDAALAAHGVLEPPFRRSERIGAQRSVSAQRAAGLVPGPLSLLMRAQEAEAGGRVAVRYYDGQADAPEVLALLGPLRAELGIVGRDFSPTDIVRRVMAELAGEGAMMLQTGLAHRSGDIDLAAVYGLGLARRCGGPMFAADVAGVLATRSLLRALAEEGAPAPMSLWDVLVKNGRRFADLDTAAAR